MISRFVTVILLCLSMMACSSELPTTSEATKSPVKSATTVLNGGYEFAFDGVILVPCALGGAGERVRFFGIANVKMNSTENGKLITVESHIVWSETFAIGLSTGTRYRAKSVNIDSVNINRNDSYPLQMTTNVRTLYIGRGAGNNLSTITELHLTINANGDITASTGATRVHCR